jgi:hypothetical protein
LLVFFRTISIATVLKASQIWKLKGGVTEMIGADVLRLTVQNFLLRMHHVAEVDGGYIEHDLK